MQSWKRELYRFRLLVKPSIFHIFIESFTLCADCSSCKEGTYTSNDSKACFRSSLPNVRSRSLSQVTELMSLKSMEYDWYISQALLSSLMPLQVIFRFTSLYTAVFILVSMLLVFHTTVHVLELLVQLANNALMSWVYPMPFFHIHMSCFVSVFYVCPNNPMLNINLR